MSASNCTTRATAFVAILIAVGAPSGGSAEVFLSWPTANPAFVANPDAADYLQPTESGVAASGAFGCVRNAGHRFHEGIDLKSIRRDRRREATDAVFSVMAGRVAYVNPDAGGSSYGRYIVVEHVASSPALYSLYAHLREIRPRLRTGNWVVAGERLGTLGRSASYPIPRERAHLHFEIGLRLSDRFQRWYDAMDFEDRNLHRNWNGLNLVGLDPIAFYTQYRLGSMDSPETYIRELPTAYCLRVQSRVIPDFVRRYPALVAGSISAEDLGGWEVEFTWYGLPKRWFPLPRDHFLPDGREGRVTLVRADPTVIRDHQCAPKYGIDSDDSELGSVLSRNLQLLFQFGP